MTAKRLTRDDWKIINEALALLEAEQESEDEFEDSERLRAIRDVRDKVHSRLD